MKSTAIIPTVGAKFNCLTYMGNNRSVHQQGKVRLMGDFKCDCGVMVTRQIACIRSGKSKSCGCLQYGAEATARRTAKRIAQLNAKLDTGTTPFEYVEDAEKEIEKAWKPSRPGAKLMRARHNFDAVPSSRAVSIGSGMMLI